LLVLFPILLPLVAKRKTNAYLVSVGVALPFSHYGTELIVDVVVPEWSVPANLVVP
jgi:hypothetical protein